MLLNCKGKYFGQKCESCSPPETKKCQFIPRAVSKEVQLGGAEEVNAEWVMTAVHPGWTTRENF